MTSVEQLDDDQLRITFTCELHPETSITTEDASLASSVSWARRKLPDWAFVGLQCFCPECKEAEVVRSFTCIGGVLLRRRRDLEMHEENIVRSQEQIDCYPRS